MCIWAIHNGDLYHGNGQRALGRRDRFCQSPGLCNQQTVSREPLTTDQTRQPNQADQADFNASVGTAWY